ncbi:MAG TPA: NADH-ubiquinone oxidoreductase-F iron-sulfur binding region domain-containing protein [Fimbriimonadaceae bacterium]|nr:NADH-ubiquinone oxidoreductase-F iron-sulfur binding region domain-containing protein [Fimbriimonadaceae bacterium]
MRPEFTGPEVDSFYHLRDVEMTHRKCRGLSCFAAQGFDPATWSDALSQWPPVYCLGKCYISPATTENLEEPHVEIRCKDPIILHGVEDTTMLSIGGYLDGAGYLGLRRALNHDPEYVIAEVERSRLRGRGGAGFPAGKKWRAVYNTPGHEKFIVANADEGDHGSYIDRLLMERTPHRLLEAMAIAGYGVGAAKGVIYLRKEYPVAETRLRQAIEEAVECGWLGNGIGGTDFNFEVEIVIGQGSYVCGEETSLLNSIEHQRPVVRARPPFPTAQGLFGKPTLVNNVETLCSVPWILLYGGDSYAARGFSNSRGTKAVSLNSMFNNPGLYEVDFGVSLRAILEDIGGGLKNGDFKAVIVGGPLAGFVHPSEFDTLFGFEEMHAIGASIGHGGIVAFDQGTDFVQLLAHVFDFGAIESCGKCTPCRLGTRRAQALFSKASGKALDAQERQELRETLDALSFTSLCGHGSGLAVLANSVFSKFPEEVKSCLA